MRECVCLSVCTWCMTGTKTVLRPRLHVFNVTDRKRQRDLVKTEWTQALTQHQKVKSI